MFINWDPNKTMAFSVPYIQVAYKLRFFFQIKSKQVKLCALSHQIFCEIYQYQIRVNLLYTTALMFLFFLQKN